MNDDIIRRFIRSVAGIGKMPPEMVAQLFVYYLTIEIGRPSATPPEVEECFRACDISPPKAIETFLRLNLTKPIGVDRPPLFVCR
jgi:hypothetical protein